VWASVDSVWEQEKLEARKMFENAAESHTSGAPKKMDEPSFYTRETRAQPRQYTPERQARKPNKAMARREICVFRGAPWFPVELI